MARRGRVAVVVQRDVLGEAELQHQPSSLAGLGDVTDAGVERLAGLGVAQLVPTDAHRASVGAAQAGDRVDQLGLPVAVDAGDADDLAGAHLEADAGHLLDAAVVEDMQALHLEQHLARVRRRLLHVEQDVAPDHQARQPGLGGARARHGVDGLAAPQHGDPVGDLEHLAELVRDEDDGGAVGGQLADDPEQLLGLLGCQHGGGLVEDEDLDPLLLADGDLLDLLVGVDREAVALAELADALPGRRVVEQEPVARLCREHDVLGDCHHGDEHEVLVHHADAPLDRVLRGSERDRRTADPDLAPVGPGEAVEDVHQRRLAGAVLAEQRVHLAPAQVEIDVVVRHDPGVALRDPSQLEDGLVRHRRVVRGRAEGDRRLPAPLRRPSYVRAVGTLTVPAMIFALSAFILAMRAAGTFGLILPTATPLFLRSKFRSAPPLNVPSLTALTAS